MVAFAQFLPGQGGSERAPCLFMTVWEQKRTGLGIPFFLLFVRLCAYKPKTIQSLFRVVLEENMTFGKAVAVVAALGLAASPALCASGGFGKIPARVSHFVAGDDNGGGSDGNG